MTSNLVNAATNSTKARSFNLDLVGIFLLAPLDLVKQRIAFRGTATLLDAPLICPGFVTQQNAPDLAKGEYPACAAMTSGYVFRVENEATVFQLQRLGKSGCLTTLKVSSARQRSAEESSDSSLGGLVGIMITIIASMLSVTNGDWWSVICLFLLMLVNITNIIVIKRRAALGWKGAPEPGVQSDLIVLLSQDRWIRIRGLTDDVKVVTSGQWLREPKSFESFLSTCATLLVYLDVVLWASATLASQVFLLLVMLASAALIGISNERTSKYRMYGRVIERDGEPKKYDRRLDLANELIRETGRKDWAIRLGMVQAEASEKDKDVDDGPKIM